MATRGPIRSARASRGRAFACLVAALALLLAGAVPASATVLEHTHFTQPYAFVNWSCGYPMDVLGQESHTVVVRADKRTDEIVYVTDVFAYDETWTNAVGNSFRVSANGVAKDVRAKRLGASEYQFKFQYTGQPIVVRDSSGALIARDRGNVSFNWTYDFATGAYNDLGTKVAGPHPLFDVDLCKVVAPITGNDSASHQTARPIGSTDSAMGYQEYLPPSYTAAGAKSPLLIALNGYGETGDGTPEAIDRLLFAGIPRFIDVGGWPTDRPFVVLSMQHVEDAPGFDFGPCDGVEWGGSCNMQRQHDLDNAQPAFCTTPDEVHDFIAYAVTHYNVDPARVYLTGLSCGAYGLFEYLSKYRGSVQVAAAVPVAGDGRPGWSPDYCGLGETPLWAFHGELDDVVNPLGSIEPMTRLAACPGVPTDEAKLTIYPGLYHDGWDQAYSGSLGDDIYSWMLGFSRP
jgi:dienelactone hydrolase